MLLVVTRWHGGVQLGPDRFRLITAVRVFCSGDLNLGRNGRRLNWTRCRRRRGRRSCWAEGFRPRTQQ